ncbi:MAG TPA: hypothetical protein VFM18_07540 [Methanosarcina sp.]|nr:hypothetical protein [Methanosarcina sp.]
MITEKEKQQVQIREEMEGYLTDNQGRRTRSKVVKDEKENLYFLPVIESDRHDIS